MIFLSMRWEEKNIKTESRNKNQNEKQKYYDRETFPFNDDDRNYHHHWMNGKVSLHITHTHTSIKLDDDFTEIKWVKWKFFFLSISRYLRKKNFQNITINS